MLLAWVWCVLRTGSWRDPTGLVLSRFDEFCFSLGFGAFYATGLWRDPTGSALSRAWNFASRLDFGSITTATNHRRPHHQRRRRHLERQQPLREDHCHHHYNRQQRPIHHQQHRHDHQHDTIASGRARSNIIESSSTIVPTNIIDTIATTAITTRAAICFWSRTISRIYQPYTPHHRPPLHRPHLTRP